MRKTKEQLEKITKYSIRKLSVGVGPVAIGVFLFGAGTFSVDKVQANEVGGIHTVHYRYLAEQELTESEKALIHHEVPVEFQNDDVLYVVYRKKATTSQYLPYTGSKELALAGLGLATASLAVFLVSKKGRKEVLGVLLIASLGASTFVPYGTFAFENKELVSYNQTISASTHEGLAEGVIHIDGYEYIGYFKEAELHLSKPAPAEKSQLAPEKQSSKEIEKTEVVQERPADAPETAVEKPVVETPVAPAVEENPVSEKPQARQEESLVEIPFETVTRLDASLAEGQTRIVTAGVNGQRLLVTKVSIVNGQEVREVIEDQVLHTPVTQVVAVGTKQEDLPSPTPVRQAESRIQVAKGTQEEGHEGESLVQPELPEYEVAEATVIETETVEVPYTTEYVNDDTRYADEETVIQNGQAGSQLLHRVYKTVNGQKVGDPISTSTETVKATVNEKISRGTKAIEGQVEEVSFEGIPFKITTEADSSLPKGTEVVAQPGQNGKKKITKVYKTLKGVKTADAPTISEEVVEAARDRIIKKGDQILAAPTLTITQIDKEELEHSAKVRYQLVKPTGVTFKSLEVVLKDGDTSLQTFNMSEGELTANLTNLKYYKEYKIATKMVYDRGNGEETETLADQPIQLDLKKIEIKDIKRTDLIKYDQETETNESRLKSIPDDKSKYYLKVTSYNQKTTLLAVKNIEEVTIDGKQMYKVTAAADNLIGRQKDQTFESEYVHYIEKTVTSKGNVYYDFEDLVSAIQKDPTGEYHLGQSMSARNVSANGKSYITNEFTGKLLSEDGKRYAITGLERPLFNVIKNATVKNVNFEDVDINRKNDDGIATVANTMNGTSVIEDVKITGSVTGRNNVAGVVNNMNEGTRIENVAFIGKLHSTSGNGSALGGIADKNYRGIVTRTYVDAILTGNKVRASSLVPFVEYGMIGDYLTGTKGNLTKSVAKGMINVTTPVQTGAFASKTWPFGTVKENVSYVKVKNAEMLFGSNDIDDEYAHPQLDKLYSVAEYSEGKKSYVKYPNKQIELTKEKADEKVVSYNITANTFESEKSLVATLNAVVPQNTEYDQIQDYNAEYKLAYKNLEKLQPFYNKEYIVNQANKLDKAHNLNMKEVLSVTPMNDSKFVTKLEGANKIIIHYADGTKEYLNLSESTEGLSNVKEYTVTGLGIKYTPNIVQKNHDELIEGIVSKLSPIELQSDIIYKHFNRPGEGRFNAVKDLYLEESFDYVKNNLTELVTKLVQNEDHQLNDSLAVRQMILDKVEKNKAALLLGLTYLNRYYGVKFGDVNIKELMLFKPDFYGKNVDVLDRLIEIGSKENNISGSRTYDAFGEVLAKYTKSGDLNGFLNYNRELFTNIDNMNDWFIDATKDKVYIAERASEVDAIKDAKYRAFDNLNRAHLRKTLLPLLNIEKSHIYLISNYNSIAFGSAERLGKKSFVEIKDTVDKAADGYRNYYDFWYRLASDNIKNRILRDSVIPIWEGYNAPGGWVDKYGRYGQQNEYSPLRELFGPIGKHFGNNGAGAYAVIYDNPNDTRTEVNYIYLNMIDEYGISVYTHETTHVNDAHIYLAGFGRREGTSFEAYAQGMLQTPVTGSGFDEFGSLGINMVFKRPNDGNQWYITDPKTLKTRDDIDRYMRGYNDALTLLDEIEAEAVISQQNKDLNGAWFKKMDKQYRDGNNLNHWDKIRHLSKEEKDGLNIQSVNDLVDQQLMTNRNPGNGVYKPEVVSYHDQSPYVGVRMMTGIYGGNTSDGAPGAVSFKHNAFRLWGYYGYENGFLGYASNKHKQASKADGNSVLSDKYVISKISGGRFSTLEEFKKAYFQEVKDKARTGLTTFEVNGTSVSSYDELLTLFKDAVTKDLQTLKSDNNGNKSVSMNNTLKLKEAVYKKLLQQTDSFKTSIFK